MESTLIRDSCRGPTRENHGKKPKGFGNPWPWIEVVDATDLIITEGNSGRTELKP